MIYWSYHIVLSVRFKQLLGFVFCCVAFTSSIGFLWAKLCGKCKAGE